MRLLPIILILLLSGCRSNDGGYRGPAKYDMAVRDAINVAISELQPVTDRQLAWKWDKWSWRVTLKPADGRTRRGSPYFLRGSEHWCGYYQNGEIIIPDGAAWETVVHEAGHLVLHKNGYLLQNHHKQFAAFFNKWSCP